MKKTLLVMLLALCLIFSLAACNSTAPADDATTTDQNQDAQVAETFMFTDSVGREVEVPTDVTRIVASGPLAQMVLFSIAPEKLVGLATEWTDEAAEYLDAEYYNLPLIGQLYGGKGDLNLEEIAAVDAQLVIDIGEPKDSIVEDMDQLMEQVGITTVHITATLDNMGEAYRMLGELLGKEEEGEELASYCEEIYGNALALIDQVGEENKVSLLYCLGDSGINVLAKDSFHSEVIDLLANNLAVVEDPSARGTGNEVDMEQILLWDPQVIVFDPTSVYDSVGTDSTWQQLSAINSGNYYEIPCGPYNWLGNPPSVNRFMGLIWLSELLYPEQSEYDLYTEAARYYNLFYHCDLTEEQFAALTSNALPKQ